MCRDTKKLQRNDSRTERNLLPLKVARRRTRTVTGLRPRDFKSVTQKRALSCYKSGELFFSAEQATKHIQQWQYPISYFDLEAISYAVPRYRNSRPYQDLPFQFSCHIRQNPIEQPSHFEFLYDELADPRLSFIRTLLEALPSTGSIVVYHQTYEISKLRDLIRDFPIYSNELEELISRIVDLKVVIQDSVYHPEFLGSFSIKQVAPALLGSDASYEHLEIGDGMEAVHQYQEMLDLPKGDSLRNRIRLALLKYCKQDSLLMVQLHDWLTKQVASD